MPSTRPSPLNFGAPSRSMSSPTASPSSEHSESRSFSSEFYLLSSTATLSPQSSPGSSYSGATAVAGGSLSGSSRKIKPHKVNANSYCGRHSDEFLFGGHAFSDLWRSLKTGNRKE